MSIKAEEGAEARMGASPPASTGSLKTKISLKPQHQQMPFALMQPELPRIAEINGRMNLLQQYDVQPPPSIKGKSETLRDYLLHVPGVPDTSRPEMQKWSLRAVVDNPPIAPKPIVALSGPQLAAFRLQPGELPERYHRFYEDVTGERYLYTRKVYNAEARTTLEPMNLDDSDTERRSRHAKRSVDETSSEAGKKKKKKKEKKRRERDE